MNKALTAILLQTMKGITSGALIDHVVDLVRCAADLKISGDDKRAFVKGQIKAIQGDLGLVISSTAGYVINLAVEVAVSYVATHTLK